MVLEILEISRALQRNMEREQTALAGSLFGGTSGITLGGPSLGQPGKLGFLPVWQEKPSMGTSEEFRVLLEKLFDENQKKTKGKPGPTLQDLAKKLISEKQKKTVEKPEEQPKPKSKP
jgi:hypothetical protein